MGVLLAHFNDDPLPKGKSAYGRIIINSGDARGLAERAVAAGAKMLRDVGPPGGPVILLVRSRWLRVRAVSARTGRRVR